MNQLNQHIEALIFCSEQSISLEEIAGSLEIAFGWQPSDEELLQSISEIRLKYEAEEHAFELAEISGGYIFLTKKIFHPILSALIQHKAKKKLSVSQMETLAIIAYKQPITKGEVEHIRGVNCDYAIQKLLEKELVEIAGRSDGPGRAVLYNTSRTFMDYFGLKSPKDLPQLKDLHMDQNEIGQENQLTDTERTTPDFESPIPQSEPEEITQAVASPETEENPIPESIDNITAQVESEPEDAYIPDADDSEDLRVPDRKTIYLQNEQKSDEYENESRNLSDDDFSV